MGINEDFVRKINGIHHQQLKIWLDECVKLNRATDILHNRAIKTVFLQQFDVNMDMAAFKSWLTYFHELNRDIYDIQKDEYVTWIDPNGAMKKIIGYDQMWQVIKGSLNEAVIIAMIDELIRIAQQQRLYLDNLHLPISDGFNHLFSQCTKQFEHYSRNVNVHQSNGRTVVEISEFNVEVMTLRYALILRRILEYSIGKKWKIEKGKSRNKYCVVYTKRNRAQSRNQRNNYNQRRDQNSQSRTFDVFGFADT